MTRQERALMSVTIVPPFCAGSLLDEDALPCRSIIPEWHSQWFLRVLAPIIACLDGHCNRYRASHFTPVVEALEWASAARAGAWPSGPFQYPYYDRRSRGADGHGSSNISGLSSHDLSRGQRGWGSSQCWQDLPWALSCDRIQCALRDRPKVGHLTLDQAIGVRIPVPQPNEPKPIGRLTVNQSAFIFAKLKRRHKTRFDTKSSQ